MASEFGVDNGDVLQGFQLISCYLTISGVVLCGRSESKRPEERSLAVYGARSARSDTVWQLELKDRLWTAYVCCCDTTDRSVRHQRSDGSANDTHENVLPGSSVAAPPPPPVIWRGQQVGNKSRTPLTTPSTAATEQRKNVSDSDLYTTEEAEVELVFEATTATDDATFSTEGVATETPTVDCGSDDDEEDVSLLCKGQSTSAQLSKSIMSFKASYLLKVNVQAGKVKNITG